ncbi:hypothetical protein [Streptomyces prasinus]|uniref:hypothetical protein n=1 Tax=Streptomyces prasinus TaxID=67345 RepID=UPI0039C88DAC
MCRTRTTTAEAELGPRIVGERLTADGVVLPETAPRDPRRRTVRARHTAGPAPATRGPLPDDRLGTALPPLRVAHRAPGEVPAVPQAPTVLAEGSDRGPGPASAHGSAADAGADVRARTRPAARRGERRLPGRGDGRRDGGTPER